MASELFELHDALAANDQVNIAEELADIVWYCALAAHALPEPICAGFLRRMDGDHLKPPPFSHGSAHRKLELAVSKFADRAKKYRWHGKTEEEYLPLIVEHLAGVLRAVAAFAYMNNIRIDLALDRNIEKLKLRYPEKFSVEGCSDRDVSAERDVLEGRR